ncbi:MAG: peptide chain release factor N(5)-glutamine methyltransferase [Alphaproteobacteria bacterium]|nr:peptide chain release factor N(5)-glutamine methyltransferase [Alphaproteobacteria bacterium]
MFDLPLNPATGAGDWLRSARDRLEAVGIETASLDARMLLLDGLALRHSVIVAEPNLALNDEEIERLEAMLSRRLAREPVSRILGWREFYGRRFEINPHVLDPRADTEVLVETALNEADQQLGPDHACRFLDIGTGSGCIAVSLLAERTRWSGCATDISSDALEVARTNAATHKVSDRLDLIEASWASGVTGPFHLVVSNPPYIAVEEMAGLMPEVQNHDPALALEAGADGLDAYRAILGSAGKFLAPGGRLLLEIGAAQADRVRSLALDIGIIAEDHQMQEFCDLAGHVRVLVLRPDAGND